jgi:signal transduction histidine kinase
MATRVSRIKHGPLLTQLEWFIRLRWIAAATVVLGSFADARWLHWYPYPHRTLAVGAVIFAYNAALLAVLRRPKSANDDRILLVSSLAQLLLDMACLTALTLWTGGIDSPLRGFFVFHMVFASLLLPRGMAYAAAAVAISMLSATLAFAGQWPKELDHFLSLAGWAVMLLMTVHLANRMTRSLRRQRRRLIKQNRHIRRMSRQLRRHQQAVVQHEKMIAVGQMAAGITHEIANPLANMDSLLQLMQRKPEKMRPDAIATLREQISRLNQMIAQMKNFAHPLEMQREKAPLNHVVAQAIDMVGFDRRLAKVHVVKELSPEIGDIPLIPQALEQVLVNLIVNALDAMAQTESPTLLIRTLRRDNWALIEVTDNGHGIRPEHMNRLAEPFFTTKPVGQGTGLGLSISYSLVQKQGGNISARSHPGKGTTFTVRLPMAAIDSCEREPAAGPVASAEKNGP